MRLHIAVNLPFSLVINEGRSGIFRVWTSGKIDSLVDRNKSHPIHLTQSMTQQIIKILLKYDSPCLLKEMVDSKFFNSYVYLENNSHKQVMQGLQRIQFFCVLKTLSKICRKFNKIIKNSWSPSVLKITPKNGFIFN